MGVYEWSWQQTWPYPMLRGGAAARGAIGAAGLYGLFHALDRFTAIGSDVRFLYRVVPFALDLRAKLRRASYTIVDVFAERLAEHPHKEAIVYEDRVWTFRDLDRFASQVANWALGQGLRKGDTVALLMGNRPEYVAIWLGLAKIGVIVALVNSTIISDSLVHSVKVRCGASSVVLMFNAKGLVAWSTDHAVRPLLSTM